jgi:hypothetical protein
MIGSKYIRIMAVLAAIGAVGLMSKSAQAAETMPGDKSLVGDQGAPSETAEGSGAGPTVPKSPLRLNTVDYRDNKLVVAGVALPGKDLYLFLDDEPIAKVTPGDGGEWSIESGMELDEGKHTLRADQYDVATDMLAARAIVSIQRAKPGADGPPPGSPSAKE